MEGLLSTGPTPSSFFKGWIQEQEWAQGLEKGQKQEHEQEQEQEQEQDKNKMTPFGTPSQMYPRSSSFPFWTPATQMVVGLL